MEVLAASALGLTSLTFLNLSGNRIGSAGLRAFAGWGRFSRLTTLNLSHNGIDDDGLQVLADSVCFPALTSLDVSYNPISDAGLQALTASGNFPMLAAQILQEVCGCSLLGVALPPAHTPSRFLQPLTHL